MDNVIINQSKINCCLAYQILRRFRFGYDYLYHYRKQYSRHVIQSLSLQFLPDSDPLYTRKIFYRNKRIVIRNKPDKIENNTGEIGITVAVVVSNLNAPYCLLACRITPLAAPWLLVSKLHVLTNQHIKIAGWFLFCW